MPLSIRPVAVCIYGEPYISFLFSFLHIDLISFPVKAVPYAFVPSDRLRYTI